MATTKRTKDKTEPQTSKPNLTEKDKVVQEYFDRINDPEAPRALLPPSPALPVPATQELVRMTDMYESGDKLAIAELNKNLSLEGIVENTSKIQISRYRKHEPAAVNKLLIRMLLEFSKSFSITNGLTGDQIKEIAAEIQVNYWHLTLEDVVVFLARVKAGHYSKLITSLDTNKMLTWLKQYDQERLALIMQKRDSEKTAYVPLKDIPRSTKTTTAKEEWELAVTKQVILKEETEKKAIILPRQKQKK